jgi:hypothetical protein
MMHRQMNDGTPVALESPSPSMYLCFPTLDALRLALTSGVVPPAVSLAPVEAARVGEQVWVKPGVPVADETLVELKRIGVSIAPDIRGANGESPHPDASHDQFECWLQLLPLKREPAEPLLTDRTPVLFHLSRAEQLPEVAGEILRLGNDRQSFRYLEGEGKTAVLLRVVGPPYYSLLRALDPAGPADPPRAYRERAPGVWVPIGFTHPLVDQVRPAPGQIVLLQPGGQWAFLDDGPFRDIYDVIEFALPSAHVCWRPAELERKLTVPLRLAASSATEPAELWVLRGQAVEQLDAFVHEADDHLLGRLAFAVAEPAGGGQPVIVLRCRPSKLPPPVLVLEGVGYRPYLKLPNLFLPCGRRLHPPLRRDAVRRLLADDPEHVTWLEPLDRLAFTPHRLPEQAFRPLQDWVDYVLDQEAEAMRAWVQSFRFEFESFVGRDEAGAAPAAAGKPAGTSTPPAEVAPQFQEVPCTQQPSHAPATADEAASTSIPDSTPDSTQRLRELEDRFLALEGPEAAEQRQALWPELARLHAAAGNVADAAVCWLHALWDRHDLPDEWLAAWLEAEIGGTPFAGVEGLLRLSSPTSADVRMAAAWIIAAAATAPPPSVLDDALLPALRQFLERHEALLPARAAWLAWLALTGKSADVLALARARDRLLARLLEHGLHPELELPGFLRFAGSRDSDRLAAVRNRLGRLRDLAQQWIVQAAQFGRGVNADPELTGAYADLLFAFGQAQLGDESQSRLLERRAADVLARRDEVHDFLLEAFAWRIEQARSGRHQGPLPVEQCEYLEQLDRLARYKVDRLRHSSRILEPQERIDPYRLWRRTRDSLSRQLALLPDVRDRSELAERIRQLCVSHEAPAAQLRILAVGLELAPRVGERFTLELLERVAPVVDALSAAAEPAALLERAAVLERGLFLAAHYDQDARVQEFTAQFHRLLELPRARNLPATLESLAGQCLRSLRKLGLRDQVDRLLQYMADQVLEGRSLEQFREASQLNWPIVLRALLGIAEGWLYFGRTEHALPWLDEARRLLFDWEQLYEPTAQTRDKSRLACAYATALGQAPTRLALERFEEFFHRLGTIRDTFTTHTHYSLSQLEVVEAVVLAIISGDFAAGPAARRWLDEDEFLVRRRIHRDLRAALERAGP